MDLDADEVGVGSALRDRRGRVAHAEPDLEHAWRVASEHLPPVGRRGAERQQEAWPKLGQRAGLARPHAAGPHDKTADAAALWERGR
jgi:hypothetical protein